MILLISSHFPPEPVTAATLCYDLAVSLSEKGVVHVISPEPTRPLGFKFKEENNRKPVVNHQILKSYTCPKSTFLGRMRESISFGKHAADFVKKNHENIQCIYVLAWPLFAQYQIVKVAKKYSIPAVTHVMDIYPESLVNKLPFFKKTLLKLLLPIDKFILQKSSKVITISSKMKEMLVTTRRLNNENVEVVHNWQNEDIFMKFEEEVREDFRKEGNSSLFTFMFLGCLSNSAALDVLVKAYMVSNLQNTRLVIAGSGSEKAYLKSIINGNCEINIEFWEAPLNKVPEIQNKADVLILGLRKNTALFAMPSKLPAYMFSKKPIIASVDKDSATANAIHEAKCGWTVVPEDHEELGKVLREAFNTPKQNLTQFGDNGFSYANEKFSRKNNLQKLTEVIQNN